MKIEFYQWYEYREPGIIQHTYYIPFTNEEEGVNYFCFEDGRSNQAHYMGWNVEFNIRLDGTIISPVGVDEDEQPEYKKSNFKPPVGWERWALKRLLKNM